MKDCTISHTFQQVKKLSSSNRGAFNELQETLQDVGESFKVPSAPSIGPKSQDPTVSTQNLPKPVNVIVQSKKPVAVSKTKASSTSSVKSTKKPEAKSSSYQKENTIIKVKLQIPKQPKTISSDVTSSQQRPKVPMIVDPPMVSELSFSVDLIVFLSLRNSASLTGRSDDSQENRTEEDEREEER